jgi:tetratricopeptide (TPR) repeat protein
VPSEIFYSYAHNDEALRDRLEKHLVTLKHAGVIADWHDRRIPAGTEWDGQINAHLHAADIILLLVSVDFLASTYCTDIEVKHAMARHEASTARVIPIILHPCDWMDAPFGKLQGLPKDAKPISLWSHQDEAFLNVVQGIRAAIKDMATTARPDTSTPARRPNAAALVTSAQIPDYLVVEFVARRDADGHDIITRLRAELAPANQRLIVLWGAGGVGKTTLAAEAARALIDTFAGRIVWTSALGRADYTRATLLDEIATQLGRADLRQLAPEPKAAAVRAWLAEAPTLVVLDNFETVTAAEQQPCADFLHDAPASALITTRQKIDGARNVLVDAMSLAEAHDYLPRLIAQTNDRDTFAQLDHERIIDTAARNPLLLQWVVAQIDGAQDPAAVLADLTHGAGDAADRVFAHSFKLEQVTDDGRAALLALALFTPSASREALAEVASFGADVPRLNAAVKRLAALWLVKPADAGKRLALEGLTRQLAQACLQKDAQAEEYQRRYVAHSLRYAEAHQQPTPEDYGALETEKDNVLGAIDVAFGIEDWLSVMKIADILGSINAFLYVRGYWDEAVSCNSLARDSAKSANDEHNAAVYSHRIGILQSIRGLYDEARRANQEALVIYRSLKSDKHVAVALHELGVIAHEQGELGEARQLYDESLEISKKLGDQRSIATTTWNIGSMALEQGELDEAGNLLRNALETFRSLQDQVNVVGVLHQLGRLAEEQGEFGEARRLYNESLEIEKKLGYQNGIAINLYTLGLLAEKEGNRAEAARLLREALSIYERLKSPKAEIARRNLARVEAEGE